MKWMMFFLTVAISHLSAAVHSQTVTFSGRQVPLVKIFYEIERQTGYAVFYNAHMLDDTKPVTVHARDQRIEDFLRVVLKDAGLGYELMRTTIVITKKEMPLPPEQPRKVDSVKELPPSVSGRVLDPGGAALPGATIKVRGSKRGTSTDARGAFSVEAAPGEVLVVTYVGLADVSLLVTKEGVRIIASSNSEAGADAAQPAVVISDGGWVLKMVMATTKMDEVVIAYGRSDKRKINGNISTITAKEIEKSPVANPLLALSGRVTGVDIRQATGFSGGGVTTLIQGQNSLYNGNDPFFVIDGVPYTSQLLPILNGNLGPSGITQQTNGNPLNYINPSDIESISILKDADATAIYGSRAANGAILITTKRGKIGRTKVNLNYQQGVSGLSRFLPVLNIRQYLEMRREAIKNDGGTVSDTDYDINGLWDTTRNVDLRKEWVGRTAGYSNMNATVSGGTTHMQYMVGGTFHRETSVMPGNWSDQNAAFHFNLNSSSEDSRFQTQLTANYSVDNNRLPVTDLTMAALILPPNAPATYNADGSYNFMPNSAGQTTYYNPLIRLENKNHIRTTNLVSNLTMSYNLLPGLNARTSVGYTDMKMEENTIYPFKGMYPEELRYGQRASYFGNSEISSWIIEPQLTYEKTFGKGKLEGLAGASIQHKEANGRHLRAAGFVDDADLGNIQAAATINPVSLSEYTYKYFGVFGRLTYSLADKYSINLSVRRDGSSRFGPANRYNNFGAVSMGWVFSDERFFKDKIGFINYGKLRASYGTTGSDQIGDYRYISLYYPSNVNIPYGGVQGLQPGGIPNPYLQWEATRKFNVGIDLALLQDRMSLKVDFYRNRSSNQLVGTSLPAIASGTSLPTNYPATVQNSGLEISWNYKLISKADLQWSVNVNITTPRNKLIAYAGIDNSSDYSMIIGKSINIRRMYHALGVDPKTGLYIFADSKGNATDNPDYRTDRYIIRDLSTLIYGGVSTTISYKAVSLDVLFSIVKQNGLVNYTGFSYPGVYGNNQPTYVMDRWRSPTELGSHQKFNADYSISRGVDLVNESDLGLTDASFVRMKNLSISWRMPEGLLRKLHLSQVRIYGQGQNLLTFTGYKGVDPENQSIGSMPPLRTFVFGLQLGF